MIDSSIIKYTPTRVLRAYEVLSSDVCSASDFDLNDHDVEAICHTWWCWPHNANLSRSSSTTSSDWPSSCCFVPREVPSPVCHCTCWPSLLFWGNEARQMDVGSGRHVISNNQYTTPYLYVTSFFYLVFHVLEQAAERRSADKSFPSRASSIYTSWGRRNTVR